LNSELSPDFLRHFRRLPEKVKRSARKNYRLWKTNPHHPGLEFKRVRGTAGVYSVRTGIGWRALGVQEEGRDTIVWFWIGSHSEYNHLIKSL
jgi:hypothetical protein